MKNSPKCLVAVSSHTVTPQKYVERSLKSINEAVAFATKLGCNIQVGVWFVGKPSPKRLALVGKCLPLAKIHKGEFSVLSHCLNAQLSYATGDGANQKVAGNSKTKPASKPTPQASGGFDIFFRADGDDVYYKHRFFDQLQFITHHKGYVAYGAGALYKPIDGGVGYLHHPASKHPSLLEHYLNSVLIHPSVAFDLNQLKRKFRNPAIYRHYEIAGHKLEDKLLWQDKRMTICRQQQTLMEFTVFGTHRRGIGYDSYRLRALALDLRFAFKNGLVNALWGIPLSFAILGAGVLIRDAYFLHKLRSRLTKKH